MSSAPRYANALRSTIELAKRFRSYSADVFPSPCPAQADQLPQDVINLVIAARELVYSGNIIVGEHREDAEALDKALEVFSERVPYDDQPDQYETEVTPSSGCVFADMGVDRPASGGWQPMDTAPKDGTDIILRRTMERPEIVAAFFDGVWRTFDHPEREITDGTHWMPLPPAPASEADHGR